MGQYSGKRPFKKGQRVNYTGEAMSRARVLHTPNPPSAPRPSFPQALYSDKIDNSSRPSRGKVSTTPGKSGESNLSPAVFPREHLKILRHCSPASAALTTQSPTSRLPSTPAPVVDYDGGRRGWGEPHLLAGAQMGGGARLARGTLLLYAPRDETEVGVVLRVLQASLLYAQS